MARSWDCYGPSAMLPAPVKVARQTRVGGGSAGRGLAVAAAWVLVACARPPTPIEQASLLSDKGQEGEAIAVLDRYLDTHPRAIAERRLLIRLLGEAANIPRAQKEAARLGTVLPPTGPLPWL